MGQAAGHAGRGRAVVNYVTVLRPNGQVVRVRLCEATDHGPVIAVATAYVVQGPIDYCDRCLRRMQVIYDVLGCHLHVDPLDQRGLISPEILRGVVPGGGPL